MSFNEEIDEEFLSILRTRIDEFEGHKYEKFERQLKSLLRIGAYIDDLKPKSKYRSFKRDVLEYLVYLNHNPDMTKDEYSRITQERLGDLLSFLSDNPHSFMFKDDWFWRGLFILAFDILLILIGLGKFYFYIPIFTIISIVRNIRRIKKAEKEGKILDF